VAASFEIIMRSVPIFHGMPVVRQVALQAMAGNGFIDVAVRFEIVMRSVPIFHGMLVVQQVALPKQKDW
jgi:hypothetical protein